MIATIKVDGWTVEVHGENQHEFDHCLSEALKALRSVSKAMNDMYDFDEGRKEEQQQR